MEDKEAGQRNRRKDEEGGSRKLERGWRSQHKEKEKEEVEG